jgi:hypothetical protein
VTDDYKFPAAPGGLQEAGRALWEHISDDSLELRPDELTLLAEAGRVADQIARLDETIAAEPTMISGSHKQPVVHPAISEARQQRALLASLLKRLDIPEEPEADGSWDGLSASQRARKAAGARWGR